MENRSADIFNPSEFSAGENSPLTSGVDAQKLTLIAGSSFLICGLDGFIRPGGLDGYYAFDTRLLAETALVVNGQKPQPVASSQVSSRQLRSYGIVGDPTTADLLVIRSITVADELVDEIRIVNLRNVETDLTVEALYITDFADVFDVKAGRADRRGYQGSGPDGERLLLHYDFEGVVRQLRVEADSRCEVTNDRLRFTHKLSERDEWAVTLRARPVSDEAGTSHYPLVYGSPNLDLWDESLPKLSTNDERLQRAWDQSSSDLGSLRLWNEDDPSRPALAAGVPWFMTLFGRDSLIAGTMSLLVNQRPLLGSLHALSLRQGVKVDRRTGEAPGKILHELRSGASVRTKNGWGETYYGTIDATPLFVNAVAKAWRWGAAPDDIAQLMEACERATAWLVSYLEAAPNLLTYEYDPEHGLANQGWKDSFDGIRFGNGKIAQGTIALIEPQGYAYAALLAMADLRDEFGGEGSNIDSARLRSLATELAERIDLMFWNEDIGFYAAALSDKRQVDSITTNPGHLLWASAAADKRVRRVTERIGEVDMATGFGIRTLSATNPGYNPLSYHCGSVWPHDTAIVISGMYSHGQVETAHRLTKDLLEATAQFNGRAPELFGGFDRNIFPETIPYPTSCSPQAWSAAATVELVRAVIGIEPDIPNRKVQLRPRLWDGLEIRIEGIQLGTAGKLSLEVKGNHADVIEQPAGLKVVHD